MAAVGIDVKDAPAAANEIRDANDITFPIVSDLTGRVGRVLGGAPTTALPTTMLIDKTGKVAAVYLAGLDPTALYTVVSHLHGEPS